MNDRRVAKINVTLGTNIFSADGDFDFNQVLLQMFKDWLVAQKATADELAVAGLAGSMARDTNQLADAVADAQRAVDDAPSP